MRLLRPAGSGSDHERSPAPAGAALAGQSVARSGRWRGAMAGTAGTFRDCEGSRSFRNSRLVATAGAALAGERSARGWEERAVDSGNSGNALCHARQMFVRREDMEAIPKIRRPKSVHTLDQVVAQAARIRLDCRCHRRGKKRATTRESAPLKHQPRFFRFAAHACRRRTRQCDPGSPAEITHRGQTYGRTTDVHEVGRNETHPHYLGSGFHDAGWRGYRRSLSDEAFGTKRLLPRRQQTYFEMLLDEIDQVRD